MVCVVLFRGKRRGRKKKKNERAPRDDVWSCPAVFLTLCLRCWSAFRGRSSFQPYLKGKRATVNKHIWGTFLIMNLERTSYLFLQQSFEASQLQAGVRTVPARSLKAKLSLGALSKPEGPFWTRCTGPAAVFSKENTLWVKWWLRGWQVDTRGDVIKEWPCLKAIEVRSASHKVGCCFSARAALVDVHF